MDESAATHPGLGRVVAGRLRAYRAVLQRGAGFLAMVSPLVVMGVIVLTVLAAKISMVDLAYLLRTGDLIFTQQTIPTVDTFTFTAAGQPWFNQQWGADLIFAAAYKLAGWTGLVALRTLLTGLIFGLLYLILRRRAASLPVWLNSLLVLGAFLGSWTGLGLRAQLLGVALFSLTLFLLAERATHPRRLWAIPVLALLWANIHGSFILIPPILGIACLEEIERKGRVRLLLLVSAISLLATTATPFGPRSWVYALDLSSNSTISRIVTEWQPTTIHSPAGAVFFLSVAVVAIFLTRSGRRAPWSALVGLGAFAILAMWAVRGLVWWPLMAVFLVAPLITYKRQPERLSPFQVPSRYLTRLRIVFVLMLSVGVVVALPVWRPVDARTGAPAIVTEAPPGITAALRTIARPDDRIWNFQPWGSWFEFALPDLKPGFDTRIETIPDAAWQDYGKIYAASSDWPTVLERWGVSLIVTSRTGDVVFSDALAQSPAWQQVYADADGAIWARFDRP